MCFYFSNDSRKMIADRDIVCYKLGFLLRQNHDKRKYRFVSKHMSMEYLKGKANPQVELVVNSSIDIYPVTVNGKAKSSGEIDNRFSTIDEGYHSYKTVDNAFRVLYNRNLYKGMRTNFNECIAEFVIPKGSVYYMNWYENVSDNIVLRRVLTGETVGKMLTKRVDEF